MKKIDYMSPLFDEEVNDAIICGAAQSGEHGAGGSGSGSGEGGKEEEEEEEW